MTAEEIKKVREAEEKAFNDAETKRKEFMEAEKKKYEEFVAAEKKKYEDYVSAQKKAVEDAITRSSWRRRKRSTRSLLLLRRRSMRTMCLPKRRLSRMPSQRRRSSQKSLDHMPMAHMAQQALSVDTAMAMATLAMDMAMEHMAAHTTRRMLTCNALCRT